jgi:hypothetical protein
MKKQYVQPDVDVVVARGERLCQAFSITGEGNNDPQTGDNHFGGGGGAPFRFKY